MQEYLDSGLRLGWLINPQDREVEVYQPEKTVKVYSMPCLLSGGDVLPNFELEINF